MNTKEFSNKILIVIGGAGSIGVNLAETLLPYKPKKIYVIDNLSSGEKGFLPESKVIEFIYCDITNSAKLKEAIHKEASYIFHLAAHFANQNSVDFPISDLKTNVYGTINLYEVCKNLKSLKKIVFASSSCVYADIKDMKVDSKLYPYKTPYAINKLVGEFYSKFYSSTFGIPIVIIRIFNTYGKYELPGKYRNVITNFIYKALRDEDIIITGDGNETRDFTYVKDTIQVILKACFSSYRNSEVFNAGTGKEIKIIDIANTIKNLTQSNSKILFKEKRSWDNIKSRKSNISKTKSKLGYVPSYLNFESNINEVILWQKNNI